MGPCRAAHAATHQVSQIDASKSKACARRACVVKPQQLGAHVSCLDLLQQLDHQVDVSLKSKAAREICGRALSETEVAG